MRSLPGRRRYKSRDALPADVYVSCDICKGKRYNRETLEVKYKGLSISEVLDLTVEDARNFLKRYHLFHENYKHLLTLVCPT